MYRMNALIGTPKAQIFLLLLILFVITMSRLPVATALYLLGVCVGVCVAVDLIFAYIRRRKLFIPRAAAITGLILALIIDPGASFIQIVVICVAAMVVKNLLRIGNRHIFNPAASGLLIGYFLFSLSPSWWGVSLYDPGKITLPNVLIMVSILLLAYVSGLKLKRYATIFSFFIAYTVFSLIFLSPSSLGSLLQTVLSPGTLFYAIVMLAEPMTSPVNRNRQMMYGGLVAVFNVLFILAITNIDGLNLPDISLISLLVGNLVFFRLR